MEKFIYNGNIWIRTIPAKTLFHSTMVHEVINRGDLFAIREKTGILTILPKDADKIIYPVKEDIYIFTVNKGKTTKYIVVDKMFKELIEQHNWHLLTVSSNGNMLRSKEYVFTRIDGNSTGLHRLIMQQGYKSGLVVDHINGDTYNNLRINLRVCTQGQNICNQTLNSNNTSNYKGVWFRKDTKKWQAEIKINKDKKSLGSYRTPEQAAQAYNNAAIKYHGEFASLNVIKDTGQGNLDL